MFRDMQKGMPGSDANVYTLQVLLNKKLSPSPNLKPDGVFGEATHSAVVSFQGSVGLPQTGIVDFRTQDALNRSFSVCLVPRSIAPPELASRVRITGKKLPPKGNRILREILVTAGLTSAEVRETTRTCKDQAEIIVWYYNIHGAAEAKKTYGGGPGGTAIAIYEANSKSKSRPEVIALMTAAIQTGIAKERSQPGGQTHLMHVSDTHITFDVSIGVKATAEKTPFVKAVSSHPEVSRFLYPGSIPPDQAYHIEIPN